MLVAEMRTQRDISKTGGGCRFGRMGWQHARTRQSPPPQAANRLVESSLGRVLLHLLCACKDHHVRWHWTGIRREFSSFLL
jgi:hypothetical protein